MSKDKEPIVKTDLSFFELMKKAANTSLDKKNKDIIECETEEERKELLDSIYLNYYGLLSDNEVREDEEYYKGIKESYYQFDEEIKKEYPDYKFKW